MDAILFFEMSKANTIGLLSESQVKSHLKKHFLPVAGS